MTVTLKTAPTAAARQRGRPRIMSPEYESFVRGLGGFPEDQTRRSHANEFYFSEGIRLFHHGGFDDPSKRWGWLHYGGDYNSAKRWRKTICAEIGRLSNFELMAKAADWVCSEQPRARAAATAIRRWRLSRDKPKGELRALIRHMDAAFDDYRARYDIDRKLAVSAAETLTLLIADSFSEEFSENE